MTSAIVIMGVAGCGKSSLAEQLAAALGARLVEGDDHHPVGNRDKMQQGIALTDADRDGWLGTLADILRQQPTDLVLTCSALKRSYRDRLRAAAPDLRFVFLALDREAAQARVAARADTHFFATSLVDSQFNTLQSPEGEPGVLRVDALLPLASLVAQVQAWLNTETCA